jgi:hypothetical protein
MSIKAADISDIPATVLELAFALVIYNGSKSATAYQVIDDRNPL